MRKLQRKLKTKHFTSRSQKGKTVRKISKAGKQESKVKKGARAYKRKTIKHFGGVAPPIEQSDIMYQDDLVCILKPDVKKGIILWTKYVQPQNMDSLCKTGLKTGKKLKSEGIEFGRETMHPYIFFRAPYYSRDIDYSTIENEIISSYGEQELNKKNLVWIRVDPNNTFVFSSECRAVQALKIYASKKTLSEYLYIIYRNKEIENSFERGRNSPWYDLYTSEAKLIPHEWTPPPRLSSYPINKHTEILVSLPHLTPEYFVLCT